MTIEELEGKYVPVPDREEVSFLIWRICSLRKKPIPEFTIEDLRIMIGQNEGLKYLIPPALEILEQDPFAEGDFYPGDLLKMVLKSDKNYWKDNRNQKERVKTISLRAAKELRKLDTTDKIRSGLLVAFDEFFS
jgi:hypothetical protein